MKTFITLLLLLASQLMSAQIKLLNINLNAPDSALLYYGIENTIEIKGPHTEDLIHCTSTHSNLKVVKGKIIVIPKNIGVDTIKVFNGKNKIYAQTFNIIKLEDPIIQISNSVETLLDKERIIAIPFVSLSIPNCIYKYSTVIYSYQLQIISKKEGQILFNMTSGEISKEALSAIQKLNQGDELHFENIRGGMLPSYCTRSFGAKVITIK